MEVYDTVIIGGGPAGLICADKLGSAGMNVLLIEKEEHIGKKVCAGGVTRKGLSLLDIPDDLVSRRIMKTALHSPSRHSQSVSRDISTRGATYGSAPINYDFRGLRFGNIYLAGEAAGVASGLTGEGIFQSLVSGIEVSRYLLGMEEESEEMKYVRKYNRYQLMTLKFLIYAGPLRGLIHEVILMMMKNRRFKAKINRGFS
jgi:flavin-dependent dehydrogenase